MWLKEGREKCRHSQAWAPDDILAYERALRFRRSPEEVKRYSEDVLTLAEIFDGERSLEELDGWPLEDRNNVLLVWRAKAEIAARAAGRG